MSSDLDAEIARLLADHSPGELRKSLNRALHRGEDRALTVVVNFGMHALPEDILKGDVFFFSEGNVNLDQSEISETVNDLTKRATRFLRGKVWNKVYLVPSGHPLLVVLATLIVYRITRVNPTVVYYLNGEYSEAEMDIRSSAVGINKLR